MPATRTKDEQKKNANAKQNKNANSNQTRQATCIKRTLAQEARKTWDFESITKARVEEQANLRFWQYEVIWTSSDGPRDVTWENAEQFRTNNICIVEFWEEADTRGRDHTDLNLFSLGECVERLQLGPEPIAGTVSQKIGHRYVIALEGGGICESELQDMRKCQLQCGDKVEAVDAAATVSSVNGHIIAVEQIAHPWSYKVSEAEVARTYSNRMLCATDIVCSGLPPSGRKAREAQKVNDSSLRTWASAPVANKAATKVYALYPPNRCYYPARIAYRVASSSEYVVQFFDGDLFRLRLADMRRQELRSGDAVEIANGRVLVEEVIEHTHMVRVKQQGSIDIYPIHESQILAAWGNRVVEENNVVCMYPEPV
ncbi:hypothetical protein FB451DRAFT_1403307 [Mycena latifolia]|nr:hypothetical protein FB451DRAFT_1403307 [Mycena latifolia]